MQAAAVTDMNRPKLSELEGTLIVGSERFTLSGRALLVLARLAARAEWINETPTGRVIANFAHGQVKLELIEALPAIRVEE